MSKKYEPNQISRVNPAQPGKYPLSSKQRSHAKRLVRRHVIFLANIGAITWDTAEDFLENKRLMYTDFVVHFYRDRKVGWDHES